jgi:hypothetical protein
MRAGTLNVPGIADMGQAAGILDVQRHADASRLVGLRDQMLAILRQALPDITVNGSLIRRLPGNLSITIPGTGAGQLIEQLSGLAISTGSACNTGQIRPLPRSHRYRTRPVSGTGQHPDRDWKKHHSPRRLRRSPADRRRSVGTTRRPASTEPPPENCYQPGNRIPLSKGVIS